MLDVDDVLFLSISFDFFLLLLLLFYFILLLSASKIQNRDAIDRRLEYRFLC